jgi:hypothetical protein
MELSETAKMLIRIAKATAWRRWRESRTPTQLVAFDQWLEKYELPGWPPLNADTDSLSEAVSMRSITNERWLNQEEFLIGEKTVFVGNLLYWQIKVVWEQYLTSIRGRS